MVKSFNEMDRTLMKITIHIVNNLEYTKEEIQRVAEGLKKACENEFEFNMTCSATKDGCLFVEYNDCNKKPHLEEWTEFQNKIPNYICFEDWCTIFVKEYMRGL